MFRGGLKGGGQIFFKVPKGGRIFSGVKEGGKHFFQEGPIFIIYKREILTQGRGGNFFSQNPKGCQCFHIGQHGGLEFFIACKRGPEKN